MKRSLRRSILASLGILTLLGCGGGGGGDDPSAHPQTPSQPVPPFLARFVAFESRATNLVAGDTNGLPDIFIYDRKLGGTTRASVSSAGTQATGGDSHNPSMTADSRFVAFESYAANLVTGDTGSKDVFVHDRDTDGDGVFDEPGAISTVRMSLASGGSQADAPSTTSFISGP